MENNIEAGNFLHLWESSQKDSPDIQRHNQQPTQYVDKELIKPVTTVRAAMTPTVTPAVGSYVKSDPIETAARIS